jgi:hypothetical protein
LWFLVNIDNEEILWQQFRDQEDLGGRRDQEEHQVHVDPLDRRENRGRRVQGDYRVMMDCKDHRVFQEQPLPKAIPEILVLKVTREIQV